MFIVQVYGTVVGSLVNYFVMLAILKSRDLLEPDPTGVWDPRKSKIFYSASILWGAIGPAKLFGPKSMYHPLLSCFLIGFLLPLPTYFLHRRYPNSPLKFHLWNIPIIAAGAGMIPQIPANFILSAFCVAFVFQYYICRNHQAWWKRYNYVLSAALDAGAAVSSIFVFFLTDVLFNVSFPAWWGNDPIDSEREKIELDDFKFSLRMVVVYWFRKALRLHDNPSLNAAIKKAAESSTGLLPLFCLDPEFARNARVGIRRWIFLLQSLSDLNAQLIKRGSRLFVLRGDPTLVFPELFRDCQVSHVFYETDNEPYALKRDDDIQNLCIKMNIEISGIHGHTLFDPAVVCDANNGKPPLTFRAFEDVISRLPKPSKPLSVPIKFPPVFDLSSLLKKNCVGEGAVVPAVYHRIGGKAGDFSVPDVGDFGFTEPAIPNVHPGGECEAIRRLDAYMADKKKVALFEKPKTSPATFQPADTTVLSPYLKFGCLSSRLFYHRLMEVYASMKHSQPPVSLLGQLYWREFYYAVAFGTPGYHSMKGNPICLQIEWRNENDQKTISDLEAWTTGQTGFPWIDAIMVQLRQEGWIHHLARHSVACFLTRGDLYINWERGMEVFEELLLDADPALNAGNWMWLSASAFFHQYFRVYSPIAFGKKYDPKGVYIRKYLPVLKNMPDAYIYEPWTAPKSVQTIAKCVIGKDYPVPICNHDDARKKCLANMKKAYDRGLYGDGRRKGRKDDDETSEQPPRKKSKSGSKKETKTQTKLDTFFKK